MCVTPSHHGPALHGGGLNVRVAPSPALRDASGPRRASLGRGSMRDATTGVAPRTVISIKCDRAI